MKLKETLVNIIVVIMGVAILFSVYFYFKPTNKEPANQEETIVKESKEEPENNEDENSKLPENLVTIYVREISSIQTGGRSWPVVELVKNNKGRDEVLAKFGKVGEYPLEFKLNTDKTKVYANLETRLASIDLVSKKVETVYSPTNQIQSFALTSDGSQMYIFDHKYASDETQYSFVKLNLSTKKIETITSGNLVDKNSGYAILGIYNDRLIMYVPMGEAAQPASLNLKTGIIDVRDESHILFTLSPNYQYMVNLAESVPDICNEFSGESFSTFSIVDPVSYKQQATFGQKGKKAEVVTFSADSSKLLYQTFDHTQDCQGKTNETYYLFDIKSKKTATVSNFLELFEQWQTPVITVAYDNKAESMLLKYGNEIIVKTAKETSVLPVGAYFE